MATQLMTQQNKLGKDHGLKEKTISTLIRNQIQKKIITEIKIKSLIIIQKFSSLYLMFLFI